MDLLPPLEAAARLIDRWLAYQVYADRTPGLSIGLIYQDRVLLSKGYGYANIAEKVQATDTTGYRIASFSKIFTATAIMQLFEQGKLNLDERVQQYVPWCRSERDPETAHLTIRQLLSHTSGMIRDGNRPQWTDFHFPSLAQFQQQITDGAMTYQPAVHWKYSNFGYTLLGAVVQAVSGVSYDEYVTEHIVHRLGLSHTAPVLTDEIIGQLALGYSRDLPEAEHERSAFPHIETYAMSSATGFSSNVADFCQFMRAQFDDDARLLDARTKREMRRIQWRRDGHGEGDADWCLGFETWKISQHRYYGHGGSFQGYRSRFAFDPERQIGLVVFANAMDAPAQDLAHGALQILEYVLNHFAEFETVTQPLEPYEGVFRNIWSDVAITAVDKQLLFYTPASRSLEHDFSQLQYVQEHQFTLVNGTGLDHVGETVRFEFDDMGSVQRIYVGPNPFERLEFDTLGGR